MNLTAKLIPLILITAAGIVCAQIGPNYSDPSLPLMSELTPTTTSAPATAPATAPADISPEARALLGILYARKATLKDFTAQIDNNVQHLAGDSDGNIGTVDYTDDATNGPRVSVHFTDDTTDGKPFRKHERFIVLDSKALTLIDVKDKQFKQQLAPPGKPFDPASLESPIPIPIGIDVAAVIKNFQATLQPATDPNLAVLRLIPRVKGTYDFTQIEITIDKKLELPIKLAAKGKGGDITTIKFLKPQVNTGNAKIADTTPPTAPGWTIEIK